MQLREHQIRSLSLLKDAFRAGYRRVVVQLPTGAGKTHCAAAIIQAVLARGNRAIFTVPDITLVDQTVERFRAVGIDNIGVMQAQHELTDASQPVQVCSIQTLMRRDIPDAHVVIVDECHKQFDFLYDWMSRHSEKLFIGLSATPWAKGMGKEGRWEKLVVGATMRELMQAGFLSGLKAYAPNKKPDLSKVKVIAGDYDERGLHDAMNKPELTADIITTWQEKGKGLPTVCFAVNRIHASTLQERFVAAGVNAAYMDAFTSREDRKAIIKQFENGDVEVICNVGVLTTGFDSDVRCIILARPTRSEMLFTQMIGRGLRIANGKDHCLLLDHSDTTARLGFVTDIHHTALDRGQKKKSSDEKEDDAPKPKECPACHFLKPPKVHTCPECGFAPKPEAAVRMRDGELIEYRSEGVNMNAPNRKAEKPKVDQERWYRELVLYERMKSYKRGWAWHKFREKFKSPPPGWFREVAADRLSEDVHNWLTSQNIRRAYAQRKAISAQLRAPV